MKVIILSFPLLFIGAVFFSNCSKSEVKPPEVIPLVSNMPALTFMPALTLLTNLKAHKKYIFYISFSKNMKYMASGSADKTVIIWNVSNWSIVKKLSENYDAEWGIPLKFTPDNRYLLYGSYENLKLLSVNSGFVETNSVLANHGGIQTIAVSPDSRYAVTAGVDGEINIFTIPDLDLVTSFIASTNQTSKEIWSIDISPDGKYLISGGQDHYIKIWSFPGLDYISGTNFHSGPIEYVRYSHDGGTMLSASADSRISIWKSQDLREPISVMKGKRSGFQAADFTMDDRYIVAGSDDYNIYVFNANSGQLAGLFGQHFGTVMAITVSWDSNFIASGSSDKIINIWKPAAFL